KQVDVVLQRNVAADTVRDKIAAAAGVDPATLQMGRGKVRVVVEPSRLDALAAIDQVHHLEEVAPTRLFNDIARQILRAHVVQANATDLKGAGQVVAVADTGFDQGDLANVHPAFTGRVQKLYALGRPQNANDPDGHGTHVAGSVLGDGTSAVLGIAPRGPR